MSNRTSPSPAPLESHLGYWLRFVSNHVSHAFKEKVDAKGVTVAEWVVLRALFDSGEVNPSQISAQVGLTRGAVSKLMDRLIAKKLVSSSQEKADRRYQKVKLTAAGQKLVPVLAALAGQNDEEFFGHLNRKMQTELMELLKEITRRRGLKEVPVD